jgi:hypothetical protein
MRTSLLFLLCLSWIISSAQSPCSSYEYQTSISNGNAGIVASRASIENFIAQNLNANSTARGQEASIKIPVVVHILYHFPGENISDAVVLNQIAALNRDFRKLNSDTNKIPSYFKSLAADCGIEFQLATADPRGRATNGIIHKYTPITKWDPDDKIKFSSEMGDDAWDSKSYLNIWVASLSRTLGYSSFPGDPAAIDGVVINNSIFGNRVAVHEIGHWLGLRHLWGDANCGDDGVGDTPKQETFTNGCPSGVRLSCGTGPYGDLYMNYMDFTSESCIVMFTNGQKSRMRAVFAPGGPRNSILTSGGLGNPGIDQVPLPDSPPQWLHVQTFPNPVRTELTINLEYDERWIGKELTIYNVAGQIAGKRKITSKIQKIDVAQLQPGIYFIKAEKNGEKLLQKFVKL